MEEKNLKDGYDVRFYCVYNIMYLYYILYNYVGSCPFFLQQWIWSKIMVNVPCQRSFCSHCLSQSLGSPRDVYLSKPLKHVRTYFESLESVFEEWYVISWWSYADDPFFFFENPWQSSLRAHYFLSNFDPCWMSQQLAWAKAFPLVQDKIVSPAKIPAVRKTLKKKNILPIYWTYMYI